MSNRNRIKAMLVASSLILSGQSSFALTCVELFGVDTGASSATFLIFHKGSALEIATEAINKTTVLEKELSDFSIEAQDIRAFLGSIANYEGAYRFLSTIADTTPDLRNSFKVIADLWKRLDSQVRNYEFLNAKNTLREITSVQEKIAKEIERLRSEVLQNVLDTSGEGQMNTAATVEQLYTVFSLKASPKKLSAKVIGWIKRQANRSINLIYGQEATEVGNLVADGPSVSLYRKGKFITGGYHDIQNLFLGRWVQYQVVTSSQSSMISGLKVAELSPSVQSNLGRIISIEPNPTQSRTLDLVIADSEGKTITQKIVGQVGRNEATAVQLRVFRPKELNSFSNYTGSFVTVVLKRIEGVGTKSQVELTSTSITGRVMSQDSTGIYIMSNNGTESYVPYINHNTIWVEITRI